MINCSIVKKYKGKTIKEIPITKYQFMLLEQLFKNKSYTKINEGLGRLRLKLLSKKK